MCVMDRLLKVVEAVFGDEIKVEGLKPEMSLREDLGINSIGMLYMAMAMEQEFSVQFNNQDFEGITTVGDVIACIEGKL